MKTLQSAYGSRREHKQQQRRAVRNTLIAAWICTRCVQSRVKVPWIKNQSGVSHNRRSVWNIPNHDSGNNPDWYIPNELFRDFFSPIREKSRSQNNGYLNDRHRRRHTSTEKSSLKQSVCVQTGLIQTRNTKYGTGFSNAVVLSPSPVWIESERR